MRKRRIQHVIAVSVAAFVWLSAASVGKAGNQPSHVHGLAYSADGTVLLLASHAGLKAYRDGQWLDVGGTYHDLIGLSGTRGALYSSGHIASDGLLGDPIGLVRSTDGGRSWQEASLAREAEFHVMDVGFSSGAIYVINNAPNSQMPEVGLYFSRDDGKSWVRCTAAGLPSSITRIAVHPVSPSVLAAATLSGVYVSHDFGRGFQRIGLDASVSAITFDAVGSHVLYAVDAPYRLLRTTLDGATTVALSLPELEETSFVKFIVQNRTQSQEIAIATRRKNVFLSNDGGRTWRQIMRYGP